MHTEEEYKVIAPDDSNELYHHGVQKQKWGIRRYRNYDGTLTEAGKARYYKRAERKRKRDERKKKFVAKIKNFNNKQKARINKFQERLKIRKAAKEEKAHNHRMAGSPSKKWQKYTNEELEAFNTRQELESKATQNLMKKLDAPRVYMDEVYQYLNTLNNLYDTANKLASKDYTAFGLYDSSSDKSKNNDASKTESKQNSNTTGDKKKAKHSDYDFGDVLMSDVIAYNEGSYLEHHGILGQKWGIRRYRNKDGTLTEAGKKRYEGGADLKKLAVKEARRETVGNVMSVGGQALSTVGALSSPFVGPAAGMTAYGVGVGLRIAGQNKLNRRFDNNEVQYYKIKMKKGDEFQRISLNQIEPDDQRLYLTYLKDKSGSKYYTKEWSKFLKENSKNFDAKVYRNTYKLKTDVVAPSLETRRKIIDKLITTNKKIREKVGEDWALEELRRNYGAWDIRTVKDANKKLPMLTKKEIETKIANEKKWFNESYRPGTNDYGFFTAVVPTDEKLMKTYINELKKEGYNAVFDDNSGQASTCPFIVFDNKILEQTSSKEVKVPIKRTVIQQKR